MNLENTGKRCETCKYHDNFSWVCFNGASQEVAGFTEPDDYCLFWESKDGNGK